MEVLRLAFVDVVLVQPVQPVDWGGGKAQDRLFDRVGERPIAVFAGVVLNHPREPTAVWVGAPAQRAHGGLLGPITTVKTEFEVPLGHLDASCF